MKDLTVKEARKEFMRIVKQELPKVCIQVKRNKNGLTQFVKATQKDVELSRRLSRKLNRLMEVIYGGIINEQRERTK